MCEYAQKAKPDGLLLGRDPAVLCEEPHVLGVFVSEARATQALRSRAWHKDTATSSHVYMHNSICTISTEAMTASWKPTPAWR